MFFCLDFCSWNTNFRAWHVRNELNDFWCAYLLLALDRKPHTNETSPQDQRDFARSPSSSADTTEREWIISVAHIGYVISEGMWCCFVVLAFNCASTRFSSRGRSKLMFQIYVINYWDVGCWPLNGKIDETHFRFLYMNTHYMHSNKKYISNVQLVIC